MSKELAKTYDPKQIEEKLYERWCENKYFHAEVDRSKKPFTTVMPPPNITGKLHMGHALDNTLQDILIRYKRMKDITHCGFREQTMQQSLQRLRLQISSKKRESTRKNSDVRDSLREHGSGKKNMQEQSRTS